MSINLKPFRSQVKESKHLLLPFHFDELYALFSELNHSPDIIAISESCLKSSTQSFVKINLGSYCVEHTTTESSNEGTLLK